MCRFLRIFFTCLFLVALSVTTLTGSAKVKTIRVGYFPNITHAQALIGMADETFQKAVGKGIKIQSFIFNAGPSVIEAMMAGQLDLAYVGPNPAINGYIRTKGTLLRVIAGAASGGAALVVRADLGLTKPAQLSGLSFASPQLGNTQDVALRHYLAEQGFKPVELGGTVKIMPVSNPDQLTLFQKKEIHGAWTVEPWVSRLVLEAGGTIFCDERTLWPEGRFVTANLIAAKKFMEKEPGLVTKWLKAHVTLTRRINANLARAEDDVNTQIKKFTGKPLPREVIHQAFSRFEVTYDPVCTSLKTAADHAFALGFLGKDQPDLSGIYDLSFLNRVLREMKLPEVK